ncbi:MAG: hypothetical protein UT41_C0002G0103 [Candidatus Wolfebacteria bacterium GW2011_GWC2_39_22]|uniref:Uncharacterized protein n=2 Tax=Candidatus Wolfeibacteriota TaxID=1752735 RepID=A0A0G1JGV3_9BACT|nr:MAG: hypothetical protein UT41_C0002G0103 [Candidatus Wolfebacteria bacterium GW2011_GWC2_39_22]KKT43237.1 MAG: hypothetical protein UW32_C0002G0098 [Candidatus Wolfebacteria bacterium GW2011_GWE2_44_13]HBI25958.1 hypothetical protein [Candidatus Wolfebacteria bacterium]
MTTAEHSQIQRYMALIVLTNLGKLARKQVRNALRSIEPLDDLLWIISMLTDPKQVRTALGVAFGHKDFTPEHIFSLYTDKHYADYQLILSGAMVRNHDYLMGRLTDYLKYAVNQDVQCYIIEACAQAPDGQGALIRAFFAPANPELAPLLAEGIVRQSLTFSKIQDLMRQSRDHASMLLFAKTAARRVQGIDVDDLRWIFSQFKGDPQHEFDFINAIVDVQSDIFFHLLMETEFEQIREACANKIRQFNFTSSSISYWLVVASRQQLSDAAEWFLVLLGEKYAERSPEYLLTTLSGLSDNDPQRALIESILASHTTKLCEIAGITPAS